jgi:hypothetical protein
VLVVDHSSGPVIVRHRRLAEPHASTTVGTAVDIDLSAYTIGWSSVSPTYVVSGAHNATVSLPSDGHTARLWPSAGCHGLSSFSFSVRGSDGSAYTDEVVVLVVP